jgi:hypothetical protein
MMEAKEEECLLEELGAELKELRRMCSAARTNVVLQIVTSTITVV